MTDIIQRAEAWLKALPKADITDAAELIEELVKALVSCNQQIANLETQAEEAADYQDYLEQSKALLRKKLHACPFGNPDWPGNPGEGD